AVIALDDLVSHAPQGPVDVVALHHPAAGNENAPEGGRRASFAFSHSPLLAVRASPDPLHGQDCRLARLPTARRVQGAEISAGSADGARSPPRPTPTRGCRDRPPRTGR